MYGMMVGLLPDTGGISVLVVVGVLVLGLGVLIYMLVRRGFLLPFHHSF